MAEAKKSKEKPFEESLAELEEIVASLEKGELPLEDAMKLYEKGISISNGLTKRLKTAKLKIEELKEAKDDE